MAKKSNSKELLDAIAGSISLWLSTDEQGYVTYIDQGVRQSWPIASSRFQSYIARVSWDFGLGMIGGERREALTRLLFARAQQGPKRETALRTHEANGELFLALGDADWRAIRVNSAGWGVMPTIQGLPFVRTNVMAPWPEPKRGGGIDLLRKYVNVQDDESFKLLVAFVLAAMRDAKEYPVLVLNGPQGSAKTTTTNFIGQLVDPSYDSASKLPDNVRDLGVMARNRHLLCFDNLSFLHPKLSDAICQIATGLTVNERLYYTNGDVFAYRVFRPVVLNGIPQVVDRDDLGRRMLSVSLLPVPANAKRPPDLLKADFETDLPYILGALCDGLVSAVRNYAAQSGGTEGLVSVARWVEAAGKAYGWAPGEFTKLYDKNRSHTVDSILDSDDFARILFETLAADGPFAGDYDKFTQLTAQYRRGGKDDTYPKDSRRFVEKLKRLQPALELKGLTLCGLDKEVRDPRTRRRTVEIFQGKEMRLQ